MGFRNMRQSNGLGFLTHHSHFIVHRIQNAVLCFAFSTFSKAQQDAFQALDRATGARKAA